MKKRIICVLFAALLLLTACAKAPTWQEQYDLGVRYLSEGNYQEAVIAFTAAIEIDDKQPAAYAGLAEVYLQQGDTEKALAILQQGVDKTGDAGLQQLLAEQQAQAEHQAWLDKADQSAVAYGATAFTSRGNYRVWEDLTPEEQQFMEAAATAVIAGDEETLRNLATVDSFEMTTYTMWNDYKIRIWKEKDDETTYANYLDVELRPENGIGYFCQSICWYAQDESIIYLASCPCADWQWDGAYLGSNYRHSATEYGDDYTESTTEGTMQAGVRQGTFTTQGDKTHIYGATTNTSAFYMQIEYEDGVLVGYKEYENGELSREEGGEDGGLVWGIRNGGWKIDDTANSKAVLYW